jgi:hypothetical protein
LFLRISKVRYENEIQVVAYLQSCVRDEQRDSPIEDIVDDVHGFHQGEHVKVEFSQREENVLRLLFDTLEPQIF